MAVKLNLAPEDMSGDAPQGAVLLAFAGRIAADHGWA